MSTRTQTDRQKIRDDHADSWVAVNEGDLLIGRVADVVNAWSDKRNNLKGGNYPLITVGDIEQATGYDPIPDQLKVHCFGTVLFNEIMRKTPQVGERIRFIYKGTGKDKRGTGNPPELYSVTVASKAAADRAYAAIAASEGGNPPPTTPAQVAQVALPMQPQEADVQAPDDDDIPF